MARPPDDGDGSSSPTWPLSSLDRTVTDDVGNCRPLAECKAGGGSRNHAGEDLPAPADTVIVAPEAGTIVAILEGWYRGTDALLLQTDTGPVINFGEIKPGSPAALGVGEGSRVEEGQAIAQVGRFDHLHIELYVSGTRKTSSWPRHEPPPASLRDVVPYLLRAGGELGRPRPGSGGGSSSPTNPNASDGGGGGLVLAAAALLLFGLVL